MVKTTYMDLGQHKRHPELAICEEKPFYCYEGFRTHGRNELKMDCPFCNTRSYTTVWGFAGSGKRCENKNCGAVFSFDGNAYKRIKHGSPKNTNS